MNLLKKVVPIKIKQYISKRRMLVTDRQERNQFYNDLGKIKHQKKLLLLDAADYGNLGDLAILMAELQFLEDHFRDYQIVRVGIGKFKDYINLDFVRRYVGLDDIVVLQGGGNFGDEYKRAESTRRTIIDMLPDNKIIMFPQTMYFKDNAEGNEELLKSINIYSKHKDLTLVAREETSYKLMKEHFVENNVLLTPDIVLYLNRSDKNEARQGALLCCRNDIEGLLTSEDKNKIRSYLEKTFSYASITDTVGESNFQEVERKFDEFRKAELVITDRLHGMIFAAITGTPCIALSNYNYKVSGTYEWIKQLEYVKFAENFDQIAGFTAELRALKNTKYDNRFAIPYYEQIIHVMKEPVMQ